MLGFCKGEGKFTDGEEKSLKRCKLNFNGLLKGRTLETDGDDNLIAKNEENKLLSPGIKDRKDIMKSTRNIVWTITESE
ncbi:hypothetical protein Trydic_g1016 [Trypoxylus dichotomus]